MTGGLLVIVPVRGRPASAPRFAEAFGATAREADLLMVLDDDDGSYDGMLPGLGVRAVTYPRMPTAPKINRAAADHGAGYGAVMFMGDDNMPRTPGWDQVMMAALEGHGGTGIVYANDLLRNDLPCSALISADIIAALGWMALPVVSHFYIDNAWADLASSTGCLTYLPGVIIEHLHPCAGKAPYEGLYSEARELYWDADEAAYHQWRAQQMEADVAKVRALLP